MQVTHVPITPPAPTGPVPRPVERLEPADAGPRDKSADKALERAVVEAAGLKPDQAAAVRVALSVDEGSNRVIAKVFDKSTGELVRQIPTDEVLRNAAIVRELLGAAVNKLA